MEFQKVSNGILDSLGGLPDILQDKTTMVAVILGLLFIASTMIKMRRRAFVPSYQQGIVPPPVDEAALAASEFVASRINEQGNYGNIAHIGAPVVAPNQSKPTSDLNFVSNAELVVRPILDNAAYPILMILENAARDLRAGFRVMAQVSLERVIGAQQAEKVADASIALNGKTLEFVVLDQFGRLVLVAEQQDMQARTGDEYIQRAVMQEALRKAGVTFMEIPNGYAQSELRQQINQALSAHVESAKSA